jgi:hypothetical protein
LPLCCKYDERQSDRAGFLQKNEKHPQVSQNSLTKLHFVVMYKYPVLQPFLEQTMKSRFLNHNEESTPLFFGKLSAAVGKAWDSLGSVACKLNEVSEGNFEVMFFPALREVYGGKDDGDIIFPGFYFNVGKFVKVFDRSPAPKVAFDSVRKDFITHLMFRGYIDGVCLKVIIMECPPGGQEAVERVYTSGPKKGQVEVIKR